VIIVNKSEIRKKRKIRDQVQVYEHSMWLRIKVLILLGINIQNSQHFNRTFPHLTFLWHVEDTIEN
jgi:hypothetical protein